MALADAEVVVVDYDCPQGTADWVAGAWPAARVVRAYDRPHFNLSKARNLGAQVATSPWLLFVDADAPVAPTILDEVAPLLEPGCYLVPEPRPWPLWGNMFVAAEDHRRIGGFDETFEGWGGEDQDYNDRLEMIGRRKGAFPLALLESLQHTDERRTEFYALTDIPLNAAINSLYSDVKLDLMRQGLDLNAAARSTLYADVTRAVTEAGPNGPVRLQVTFRDKVSGARPLRSHLVYELAPADLRKT